MYVRERLARLSTGNTQSHLQVSVMYTHFIADSLTFSPLSIMYRDDTLQRFPPGPLFCVTKFDKY